MNTINTKKLNKDWTFLRCDFISMLENVWVFLYWILLCMELFLTSITFWIMSKLLSIINSVTTLIQKKYGFFNTKEKFMIKTKWYSHRKCGVGDTEIISPEWNLVHIELNENEFKVNVEVGQVNRSLTDRFYEIHMISNIIYNNEIFKLEIIFGKYLSK